MKTYYMQLVLSISDIISLFSALNPILLELKTPVQLVMYVISLVTSSPFNAELTESNVICSHPKVSELW